MEKPLVFSASKRHFTRSRRSEQPLVYLLPRSPPWAECRCSAWAPTCL